MISNNPRAISKITLALAITLSLLLVACTATPTPQVTLEHSTQRITTGPIFPETIVPNPITGGFLSGSFLDGKVYEIDPQGNHAVFIDDPRLITAMGIRVDQSRNRVYVIGSDIGVSERSTPQTTKHAVNLGIYSLTTGDPINFINLASTRPNDELHFANDLTLDDQGNIYITDSLAPLIYKVNAAGEPSIFLEAPDRLVGPGFNLNGIVFHPDGYLLVAKKNEGLLLKVPLDHPQAFQTVDIPRQFQGADGLVLINTNELVLIANRMPGYNHDTAFALMTNDQWSSATITSTYHIDNDAYPTTGLIHEGKLFVVHSRLNRFMDPTLSPPTGHRATLEQIGTVRPR